MSKVICEICGTSYPDTASECPVCGCEKPETAEFSAQDDYSGAQIESDSSTHVKGGRFSKANVNKRNKPGSMAKSKKTVNNKSRNSSKGSGSDRGLVIAIIVLLAAIIAVIGYIYISYFMPREVEKPTPPPAQTTTGAADDTQEQTQPQTTVTTAPEDLSCTGLTLSEDSIMFNKEGNVWVLNVIPTPANTTDTVTYASSDTTVAAVSADGKVTAVGDGEAVITITCGDVSIECSVKCDLQQSATQPEETEPDETEPEETESDETEPEETEPEETEPVSVEGFKLNRTEFTIKIGDTWKLYNGPIDTKDIVWRSSNSSVVTVNNGVVRGVGRGECWVTAEYQGVKLKCYVYCVKEY